MNFTVNDIVKVVNSCYQYDKYAVWAKEHGFYKEWCKTPHGYSKSLNNDRVYDEYIIRVVDCHNKKQKRIIYGIENLRTGEYHIISDEGIALVSGRMHFGLDDSLFEL